MLVTAVMATQPPSSLCVCAKIAVFDQYAASAVGDILVIQLIVHCYQGQIEIVINFLTTPSFWVKFTLLETFFFNWGIHKKI